MRLLIADGAEDFAFALAKSLQNEFEISLCHDGETALDLLSSLKPDILILHLMLPYKDGLTVLQEAAYKPKIILAMTTYINAYIEQSALALGVDFILIAPCLNAVRVRLMDLIWQADTATQKEHTPAEIAVHLHILNFSTHLDGYRQLCIGIPLFCQDPTQRLSKELYPAVAARCNCSDSRSVEHSIRKSIDSAWRHRNNTVWAKYFPPDSSGRIPCPTNKEFIARLAEILRMK